MKEYESIFGAALLLAAHSELVDEHLKERMKKAEENIQRQERAEKISEEEQREELRESVHPYERLNPRNMQNLFEEMESGKSSAPQIGQ